MRVVPLLLLFNEASINAFLDLALAFLNPFLRSKIETTSHSRLLKLRFQVTSIGTSFLQDRGGGKAPNTFS